MIELVYLNKNISKSDADKLVKQSIKSKRDLIDLMISNAEELSPEMQSKYISNCIPFIAFF